MGWRIPFMLSVIAYRRDGVIVLNFDAVRQENVLKHLILFMTLFCISPAFAEAPIWNVNFGASRIGFTTYWQNSPVEGLFKRWNATISFDETDLSASSVRVDIETGSVDTNYKERDVEIRKRDWLSVDVFPQATFVADSFRHLEEDRYVANGTLEIKGIKTKLELPFTLSISGSDAHMKGEVALSRLAFNVGDGQWRSTDFIKDDVIVRIDVVAKKSL
jgi:polyisoprenoid-binding protein YceI